MAGRSDKTPSDRAVEDASSFMFEIDAATPAALGRATPAAPSKPHYHDHRARLRQRFDEAGPGALADYELLELALFRTIPRRDTKPLAKALLARFGSLPAVLAAPVQRIAEVDGAGPALAQDLKILQALIERSAKADIAQRPVISS